MKVGDKIHKWTIISIGVPNTSYRKPGTFYCRCECGKEKAVWRSHLLNGDSKSCGCGRPKTNQTYNWTGCGDLDGNHWNQIVRNANGKKKRSPLDFNITIQYAWDLFLKQNRACALSGRSITLGKNRTASLDRIDNSKGYVMGNVQWIHKDINRMKNVYDQEYFLSICREIVNHRS